VRPTQRESTQSSVQSRSEEVRQVTAMSVLMIQGRDRPVGEVVVRINAVGSGLEELDVDEIVCPKRSDAFSHSDISGCTRLRIATDETHSSDSPSKD
jgi:hypothetical protein